MRRFAGLATVLALALAMIGLGCGGGGEEDLTKGLTPAQILNRANEASTKVTTFRVVIDGKLQGTMRTGAKPSGLEALLAGQVDLSIKGRVRRPRLMQLDVDLTTPQLPLAATLIQVDDRLYLDVLAQSFRLVTPEGAVASVEPANMPAAVLGWMAAPQDAGREEVGGTQTAHLRGRVRRESLSELGGLITVLTGSRTSGPETATIKASEIDAWIGTRDLLPRRVRFSLQTSGGLRELTSLAALSLDATLDFSAFGDPVDIAAPENPRALRLEDLTSLIGG
jgi:hypothetical protein